MSVDKWPTARVSPALDTIDCSSTGLHIQWHTVIPELREDKPRNWNDV